MSAASLQPPERVLLIKPSALGDVVTALPVLRGLRRTFPDAHLAWLISEHCVSLVRHDSQLDEVVLFRRKLMGRAWRSPAAAGELWRFLRQLRAGRYDWVIDLQGLFRSGFFSAATRAGVRAGFADAREFATAFYTHSVRPGQPHTVDRNLAVARQLGIDAKPEDMRLEVSDAGRRFVESLLVEHGLQAGELVVIAPSTTWPTKAYPIRHWRTVVEAIAKNAPVALVAGPGDGELCRKIAEGLGASVIDLAGQTRVDEMVALVAASAGVVCNDSAVKFIAPAVGVDCITLIGPTRTERTGPYLRGLAIVADLPCQGCLRRRCQHITCMQVIDPAEVISATGAMIAQRSR